MKAEDYFKGKALFNNLFWQARKTYHRFGKLTGTYSTENLSPQEKEQLAQFLGIPLFLLEEKQRLKWLAFIKAFEASSFEDEDLLSVMEKVLHRPFTTRSEEHDHQMIRREAFQKKIAADFPTITGLIDQKNAHPFYEWYCEDEKAWEVGMQTIENALNQLPEQLTRLPFFAHHVTGNPHALDPGTRTGQVFLHALQLKSEQGPLENRITKTEWITDILLEFRLVRDDIMNFVAVNGLLAFNNGKEHPMWRSAVNTSVSWNVPVRHLLEIDRIRPAYGKNVYLVENSGVYSTLLDTYPDLPIICTNGQLRLAAWILLEKLFEGDCSLYYAGDFDPEGLLIADQILQRFSGRIKLWRMDVEDYFASRPIVPLTVQRLKKLSGVRSVELKAIVEQLLSVKRAGYQEAIAQFLLEDIKGNQS